MQGVGQQGGYGRKLGGLKLQPPELTVDSLGHCQSVGNWMFNSTRSQKLQSIATMWILRQVRISQVAKSCLPAVWWAASE